MNFRIAIPTSIMCIAPAFLYIPYMGAWYPIFVSIAGVLAGTIWGYVFRKGWNDEPLG